MYYSPAQASETLYLSLRQQALDAINAYSNSAAGIEDILLTDAVHPFTPYYQREDARVYQAVQAVQAADAAAGVQDWSTACTRASEAAESMGVDVAALPSLDQEVYNQAKIEVQAVYDTGKRIVSTTGDSLLTAIQYATGAVIIVGAIVLFLKAK